MTLVAAQLVERREADVQLSTLVWRFPRRVRSCSTAAVGGGLGERSWVVNAQVPHGYARTDLDVHAADIAAALGLPGDGVVMFTAVDVRHNHKCEVEGVRVTASVGVRDPVWAAGSTTTASTQATAGTVNVVAQLPVTLAPAGLVNLIATVTEAKCQAFAEIGIAGTGTPSDAVTVLCPTDAEPAEFGGPRSEWGSRVANATHRAIRAGLEAEPRFNAAC